MPILPPWNLRGSRPEGLGFVVSGSAELTVEASAERSEAPRDYWVGGGNKRFLTGGIPFQLQGDAGDHHVHLISVAC